MGDHVHVKLGVSVDHVRIYQGVCCILHHAIRVQTCFLTGSSPPPLSASTSASFSTPTIASTTTTSITTASDFATYASGEVDDYSQGREITTRAQTGGAIEGVASDYRIPNLCFNKFFWNRFYTTIRTKARDIRTLAGKQTRSTKKYHAYSTDEDEF